MLTRSLFTMAILCSAAFPQLQSQGPVKIETGRISGALTGRNNDVSVYKGIPYAAPPVGNLRWKAPQPAADWADVRETVKFSPIPPQRQSNDPQSEDCLYLNVWTPAKSASERLPVMVWIYGGGFTYGSASTRIYDGTRLAENGVVLVSFNYRLNVLAGFAHPLLSKESGHGSGDYGMLDLIAALQWVQRNIKSFGGDPGNVTIFGESAGGIAVSSLVVSPLTRGLFHKAIVESGSAARITPLDHAEQTGEELVKKMGLDSDPNVLATLRSKSWAEIPNAQNYRGGPVIDGYAFTRDPMDFWAKGTQRNVPMIIGHNHDEATFFVAQQGEIPKTVEAYQSSVKQRFGDLASRVLSLYPATSEDELYWAEIGIRTDSRFGIGARRQLRGEFNVSSNAWEYHFSYLPEASKGSKRGVSHASELAYVFGTIPATADQQTRDVSEAMVKYWTQFAKTGDPNQPGLPRWPAFQKGNEAYLEIGQPIRSGIDLNKEKEDLFDSILRAEPRN